MNFKIGYRTAKTALGAAIAIFLAQYLGLENAVSAGILTILCIQVTRKRSIRASWDRFLACLIGIGFSALFFEGIAYHPAIIGLLLLLFIPTMVMLKASDGIVTSTVIILHIYSASNFTLDLLLNEFAIIVIGIGIALIMNLYMPSVEKKLENFKLKIEANFKKIFLEIAFYLRANESEWDGKEIPDTLQLLDEAETIAFRNVENHFLRHEDLYYQYFKMREKQFEIIERILPLISSLPLKVEQANMIAEFLEELAENVNSGNTAHIFLDRLSVMKSDFEKMDLPSSREEFEARAALVHLVKELNDYLIIKSSFKGLINKNLNRADKLETN